MFKKNFTDACNISRIHSVIDGRKTNSVIRSFLLTCFFSILLTSMYAQQKKEVAIGIIDSIHSQILKEQRKIWIHVPSSARDNAKKKYPVVYLLDGERYFTGLVGMIDLLSSVNGNSYFPEMIVVGIVNTDRFRDLTPTHVISGLWVDSAAGRRSGGGGCVFGFY